MERILCEVDGSPASSEVVRAAIAYCAEHGAELDLVGVINEGAFDPPQPAVGERIRRFRSVEYQLAQAMRAAQEAAVPLVEVAYRVGDPTEEALREARATGAARVFLGRAHTRLAALLFRHPRIEVEERALP